MARNIYQITPLMHVTDLDAAIEFMTGIMGFTVTIRMANYGYVEREGAVIRLLSVPEQYVEGNRRYAYYCDCVNVDMIYSELKPKLDTLPDHFVRGPVDRPYGVRELMVLMPDNNFLVFAQLTDAMPREQRHARVEH